ncbi:UDP-2,4-diacetamido-2,4,6-trideoxy-beta-L-altropyranose hydrolase [Phenylobacterium deserti]|uniref:UDP-2,4-diacetamido-2,4, 6-trideoxy-beta-L-altropyranose hydrolase n=1 Tax=Phenylobacterium deserti TaxID=1914756 RepID=A0A328AB14_9CAUL|nr:UDP-2,4-diacetamido-2,4,6-trideoxy-beta-L-altropyranose hydrolase [Phenylobacterium deserti]RAK51406.1 UDP-2,4-diacetamido-2,4,6-trideoxy-beta-L-altropyranose hydrolase [Phenylobacterium deserti]
MSGPRILFVVDAGPRVGGGHVMRSLTLAGALGAEGAACTFMGPPAVSAILDTFAPGATRLEAASTEPVDLVAAIGTEQFDAVVFDHYGLSERDHRAMGQGRPVLVIDDLTDRALGADLVLDPGPARRAEDYAGLVPEDARLLLGPEFAPVRPEFAALRQTALAWRGEPVHRVLISLGLTDLNGITAKVVERLRLRLPGDTGLDVVLGGQAPSLPGLTKIARRDPRLALHVDTPHMARLTAEADIAIGAAGSSVWERCVLGLPSVLLVLADNQKPAAAALAERDAALVVEVGAADFDAQLDRAVTRLLVDDPLRKKLALRGAEICDGRGADRVAGAFLERMAAGRAESPE